LSNTSRDGVVFGTVCGLLSAIGYTAANIFLRSVTKCDPVWVSCVKAFPTVLMTVPWLAALVVRGKLVMPTGRALTALVLTGALAQLGGNVMFQFSLGIVGIALAVPLTLGAMILTGAILGRFVLHEQLTWRSVSSMVVLILAIGVLSLGAGEAQASLDALDNALEGEHRLVVAKGVAAAVLSGVSYALLGVVIRKSVSGRVPLPTTLFVVSVVGAIGLGVMSIARIGVEGMIETRAVDWKMMVLAGLCNAFAFLALAKSLQLTGVVFVNALNASQVAMASLAGLVLFNEPLTLPLFFGVVLTGFGLAVMRGRGLRRSRM
jgi:DME family drug/metabolite transporter